MQPTRFEMVDLGTPLFIASWYCVMFRASSSSVSRALTASFNCNAMFLYLVHVTVPSL